MVNGKSEKFNHKIIMKILITGSAGFVASSLIDYFNKYNSDISIIGLDDFSYGYKNRLEGLNLKFLEVGIKEFTSNKKYLESFDAVIHCAAIAPLPENEIDPVKSYENNLINTIRMADYCSKIGCAKLIFFSSGAIYENDTSFPSKEFEHKTTNLVYPTSKMCAEHALSSYSRSYGLNTVALRLFNLYGPRQDYFRKQPPLIGYILKCLIKNETAFLYSDGEQRRDYIYIFDVFEIVKKILFSDNKDNFIALNIGTGNTYSVNQIVEKLSEISGKNVDIERLSASNYWDKYPKLFNRKLSLSKDLISKEVNKYSEAEISRLIDTLKYIPKVSIERGLRECYEYALKYFKRNNL